MEIWIGFAGMWKITTQYCVVLTVGLEAPHEPLAADGAAENLEKMTFASPETGGRVSRCQLTRSREQSGRRPYSTRERGNADELLGRRPRAHRA